MIDNYSSQDFYIQSQQIELYNFPPTSMNLLPKRSSPYITISTNNDQNVTSFQ